MKQRVLIFIDWFSPGFKAGGPTTSNVNIVDHLSDKFDFWIITSDTDYHSEKPYPHVKSDCWTTRQNCHVWYFSKKNQTFSSLCRAIREASCAVWYINGIYSRFYSIYPLLAAKKLKPHRTIVSARGMLSPHAFAVKGFQKKIFLNAAKLFGLYHNISFHGTNENECRHIQNTISLNTHCYPIENLPRKINHAFVNTTKKSNGIRLVSFARVSSEKNTLYAIQALKKCTKRIYYDIYGQINSEEYWAECERAISELPSNISVTYHGSIDPSKLATLYQNYDMLYLPTTGENFGHAILESFMNSRPVIISDRTPWQNLTAKNIGYDIPLNSQEDFAITIDQLADIPTETFNEMCWDSYNFAKHICESHEAIAKYQSMFSI